MRRIILVGTIVLMGLADFYFLARRSSKREGPAELTIGFGGDTMLGRLVNETLAIQPPIYPWGDLLPLLQATDVNLLNLETTLTRHTEAVPKVFNFRADPDRVDTLLAANIAIVSVANNHIRDFGDQGLRDTLITLDQAGIQHVGAGLNAHDARAPVIIERSGITLGILGATDNESDWEAGPDTPGTFYFDVADLKPLLIAIKELALQVDLVIVSVHWGPNKRQRPTLAFQKAAHAMIDAGADIIHGHSAHIFQGVEVYKNKLIMYDTGDFVDDYAVDPLLRNDQTFFFRVTVRQENNGATAVHSLELIPALIRHMQVNRAMGQEAAEITAKMRRLSAELGTDIGEEKATPMIVIA